MTAVKLFTLLTLIGINPYGGDGTFFIIRKLNSDLIVTTQNVNYVLPLNVVGPLVFGDQVIAQVLIKGNQITRDNVIRRELAVAPGDTLHPEALQASSRALEKTGLFKDVEVYEIGGTDGQAVVHVEVSEKRIPFPYPIIGIDQSSGWYAGLGVAYPNLLGRGLHFDLGGEIGFKARTTPRWRGYGSLFMPMTPGRWHGEKLAYEYTHLWRKDAQIFRLEHRASYRQDFRVHGPLYFSLDAGFIHDRCVTNDSSLTLQPTFSPAGVDQSLYVRPILTLDMRDDSVNTTRGVYAVAFFNYNPGLSEGFINQKACSLSVAGYVPIGKTVLAGNIFTYQQLDSIPVYRTIYVGKDRFVRGWKDTTQVGSCLTVASVELRRRLFDVHIIPDKLSIWFGASVNFDVGAIHEPGLPPLEFASSADNFRHGLLTCTGIGIAAGTGNLVGKLELVYGIGSDAPFPFTIPAYFGWRF